MHLSKNLRSFQKFLQVLLGCCALFWVWVFWVLVVETALNEVFLCLIWPPKVACS